MPPEQAEPPKPEVKPTNEPSGKTLTQAEYDQLMEKASRYDLMANDAELAPKIVDHYRAKTGRIGTPPARKADDDPPIVPNNRNSDVDKEMIRRQAELEIKVFKMENPDMAQYKDDMARLMQRYNMPIEEAYRLSKAAKTQAAQKPVEKPNTPAVPTTETNVNAGDDSVDDLSEVEKRINDPKATPRLDDAMELAWKAAQKQHSEEG